MTSYFSDRERGPRPRTQEEITSAAWGGIIVTIESRVRDGSFGYRFPLECEDGKGAYGCSSYSFATALKAEVPEISWPLKTDEVPDTLAVLDLLEFCHRMVARPVPLDFHSFFGHTHLGFQPEQGQGEFRADINRIFARNGLAYEVASDGQIIRLAPPVLGDALASAAFKTGDAELDALLTAARTKYLGPDPAVRRESLEKLWDAWERLKTLEAGKDKKESTQAILDKAASEASFRETLGNEALEVTRIGNTFRIRHSETTQIPLQRTEHVDYLFHRLFALMNLLLRSSNRG